VKAEDAKLPGAGISLKPCPRKCAAERRYVPDPVKSAWGETHVKNEPAAVKLLGVGQFPGSALIQHYFRD
jgi:hypothetical protein